MLGYTQACSWPVFWMKYANSRSLRHTHMQPTLALHPAMPPLELLMVRRANLHAHVGIMCLEEGKRHEQRQQRLRVRAAPRQDFVTGTNTAKASRCIAKLGLDVLESRFVHVVGGVGAGVDGCEDGQNITLALGVVLPHVLVEMQIGMIGHFGEMDDGITESTRVNVKE